ncbi:MAG: undecaprenyldiphospho-muramoylpentapeptide beta-N-acetylglucosaminyltransferase [Lachnospiraceae bacterium]|nr:undecaprenyldiphospho-muramoylpentapeptide beta-N-acetylglucosaminyltransferase [Lachnospiraceae bacterium]
MKKIVLTGGGTAGHVTPNIALIPRLKELGYEIHYIGSKDGIEKELIGNQGIPYYEVSTGKLRRYFDLKNFSDPFRILKGLSESKKLMKKIQPDIVFSKGGFVAVPVVFAANSKHVPVIIHESDMTPGLANKLCISKASKICCNFPETMQYLPAEKAVLSGSPIRKELFEGSREAGLAFCGFTGNKPVILIIGGSLGSVAVNNAVRHALDKILKDYDIIHLCGKGNLDTSLEGTNGYRQYEYIEGELKDLMAAADLVISRAGANAICELLALKKPHILVPLPADASRGDQLLNADSFKKQGFSYVLAEGDLSDETLLGAISHVAANRETYIEAMAASPGSSAVDVICDLIVNLSK